jgi:hypothetical protein
MFFLRIFMATLILSGFFLAVQPVQAVKPMAPLEMSLELGGTPQVGGEVPVVLKVRSFIEIPQVKIQLTLPSGIEIVSGHDIWEGELPGGSLKELTFILKIKGSGRHVILAWVMTQFQDGLEIAKSARLLIDLEPPTSLGIESKQQDKEKKESRTIKGKDGQDLKIFSFEKIHK